MTHHDDIIELIRSDHIHVRELFSRIEAAGVQERGELFRDLVAELARHEAAEEAIVHPTLRDETDGGGVIAQSILEEESQAEKLLARMEDMDPASDEFLNALGSLRDDVIAHADHEENEEHPLLRQALSQSRLKDMAEGWQQLKERAPTRPHPHTPQTPEVRAVVGPVAAIFDRARDAARELVSR